MTTVSLPYVTASGNVKKALEKIQTAQTPPRFTQDFLATKLGMKGGGAKPVIPLLKRAGFLASDGVPTDLYKRFRNPTLRGAAAAEGLRTAYQPLYESNEYIHDASDADLKGLVVQLTGSEPDSSTVGAIIGTFKAFRAFADFDTEAPVEEPIEVARTTDVEASVPGLPVSGLALGYTINLHLPATSDVEVFNAIFKSLREHLLTR